MILSFVMLLAGCLNPTAPRLPPGTVEEGDTTKGEAGGYVGQTQPFIE